jgi:hypothetical protein
MISGGASNPGGVSLFSIKVEDNNFAPLYTAKVTAVPDTSGKAPDLLSIPGVDGHGGIGGNPMAVRTDKSVRITATASNFNGMTTSYQVLLVPRELWVWWRYPGPILSCRGKPFGFWWRTDYWIDPGTTVSITPSPMHPPSLPLNGEVMLNPSDSLYPKNLTTYTLSARTPFSSVSQSATVNIIPTIDTFQVVPTVLDAGGMATITWSTTTSTPQARVALTASDGTVLSTAAAGTLRVMPGVSTSYKLHVQDDCPVGPDPGTFSQDSTVSVRVNSAPSSCTYFYFRVTYDSIVTPCIMWAACASDAASAKQLIRNQNINALSIDQVDYGTYINGCSWP